MSNVDTALDSLERTALRVADERNKFKAQRDLLFFSAKQALKQINPRIRAAKLLREAIANCEEE